MQNQNRQFRIRIFVMGVVMGVIVTNVAHGVMVRPEAQPKQLSCVEEWIANAKEIEALERAIRSAKEEAKAEAPLIRR